MRGDNEDPRPTPSALPPPPSAAPAPTSVDTLGGAVRDRARELAPAGYEMGALLGRGGMGEVLLARDQRIGRDVAIKRMRTVDPTPEQVQRFLREATVQARLDHPAIVPVHELGHDAEGRPYFTMKRLAGVTMWELLRAPDAQLQRLLRAFAEVCLAIELAHSRNIVHRDLKPANIMLGDFGEVYVLDWGIARELGEAESPRDSLPSIRAAGHTPTQTGALLGTPGYMAPEQIRGEPVGPHADVYALGAILFEILTGESLHPHDDGALASTLESPTASPAQRCPARAIAPELDAACVAALAEDPADRSSARQLADRVQRYLDGDRDLERRRALAATHLASARTALTGGPSRRAEAFAAAGRALALDPESRAAAALVTGLMLEPPAEAPPELAAQIVRSDNALFRQQGRYAAVAVLGYLLIVPVLVWMGITNVGVVCASYALVFGIAIVAWRASVAERPKIWPAVVLNIVLMMTLTRWVGPFLCVPGLICAVTVALLSFPPLVDRYKLVIGAMLCGIVVPLVLEWAGVLTSTWGVENGAVVARSAALSFHGTSATVFLIFANVGMIVVLGLFARSIARTSRDATHRLENQAWHLQQLLPPSEDAPTVTVRSRPRK